MLSVIGASVLIGVATLYGTFFVKLYCARMLLIQRRRKGLPVAPGHSFLFGHLLYLKSYIDRLPKDAHYQYAFGEIGREHFAGTGAYYIDLWPMTGITLLIISPKIGGPSMFDVNEEAWKPWRAVFNKGFHSDHINSLVPGIVQEVSVYANPLRTAANKNEFILLEPLTLRFMIDVIGKTILNSSLGSQTGYNALADGMLSQIQWWHNANNEVNPLAKLNFIRAFMQWKNGRQMDQYIGTELDKRYEEYKTDPESAQSLSVIDLVLPGKISENPRLVNNLEYTLAVIKEAMRLYPPAGASRDGEPGVHLTDDAGNSCPTDDTILWILHGEVHQWEKYWVRGTEFLPERWMVGPRHKLYPRPGTWRPFEIGPRNCIAQAMVLVELRIVLVRLARTFDVKPAYDEWDAKRGAKGNRLVHGERAYQIEKGASHPVGGYPCRVTLVNN